MRPSFREVKAKMTETFRAEPDTTSLVSEIAALHPMNPFYTPNILPFAVRRNLRPGSDKQR